VASRGINMKAIEEEIARVTQQRDALSNRIDGLKRALSLINGDTAVLTADLQHNESQLKAEVHKTRQRRGGLKNTVLDIVGDQAERGLTVNECVVIAAKAGTTLDRASVSSLLSRLKKDDVLFYDGERYRLKQYAGPRHAA